MKSSGITASLENSQGSFLSLGPQISLMLYDTQICVSQVFKYILRLFKNQWFGVDAIVPLK